MAIKTIEGMFGKPSGINPMTGKPLKGSKCKKSCKRKSKRR